MRVKQRPTASAVPDEEIQALVKTLRIEVLRVTQEHFGLLMGVSRQTVYWWEAGRSRPTKAHLKHMNALVGLDGAQPKQ